MFTGEIRNQIDRIWDAFWSGGIANPLEVIEQSTYLLFLKRLDELETAEELKTNREKKPMKKRFFPAGKDKKGRPYHDFRWSRFKNLREQLNDNLRSPPTGSHGVSPTSSKWVAATGHGWQPSNFFGRIARTSDVKIPPPRLNLLASAARLTDSVKYTNLEGPMLSRFQVIPPPVNNPTPEVNYPCSQYRLVSLVLCQTQRGAFPQA